MSRRAMLVALALLAAAGAAGSATAHASPGWLPTAAVSSTEYGNYGRVDLAADARGSTVAVWARDDGATQVVRAAIRPATTRTWQAPENLSLRGRDAGGAKVAMSPDGTAIAVWTRSDGANSIVQSAVRPVGTGAWQAPQNLSALGRDAIGVDLAIGPEGDAIAVWTRFDGSNWIVQSAMRPAGTGTWASPQDVSSAGRVWSGADVGTGPSGAAIAIWVDSPGPGAKVRTAVRSQIGGTWQPAQDVAAGEIYGADLAVGPRGDAVAAWSRAAGTSSWVEGAYRGVFEGVWRSPQALSSLGAEYGAVRMDGLGTATAVWSRAGVIEASSTSAAGVWGQAVVISGPGTGHHRPDIASGPRGEAIAVWVGVPKERFVDVISAVRPPGSTTWQSPQSLSFGFENPDIPVRPSVAIDPQGNAVTAWPLEGRVEAAGHDASGPLLESLTITAEAPAGVAAPFSVAPVDAWSGVATTRWDFGDGVGESGSSVSYAFAAPGTYDVTVTAVDGLGNSSSATRSIRVLGAPPVEQVVTRVEPSGPAPITAPAIMAPPLDRDGDGAADGVDRCPDEDARSRDRNRNGCLDYTRLRPVVKLDPGLYGSNARGRFVSRGIKVDRLTVGGLPRGTRVALTCTRQACPRQVLRVPLSGRIEFKRLRERRLRTGVRIRLLATSTGAVGEGTTYVVLPNDTHKSSFCIHPVNGRSCDTLR